MRVAINSNSVPVYASKADVGAKAYCPRCGKRVQVKESKYGAFWKHMDFFEAEMCRADDKEKVWLLRERVRELETLCNIQQRMTREAKTQVKNLKDKLENTLDEQSADSSTEKYIILYKDGDGVPYLRVEWSGNVGIGTVQSDTVPRARTITSGSDSAQLTVVRES